MTFKEQTVHQVRDLIAKQPMADQHEIHVVAAVIRQLLADHGKKAAIGLALVSAEVMSGIHQEEARSGNAELQRSTSSPPPS